MIEYTTAERLFIRPIKEVFSGAFFGYSVIHEAKSAGDYDICFSLDGTWSPFTYELKRYGIQIDMGMLDFRIRDRVHDRSNIEMTIFNVKKKNGERLVVQFDNSATALLLETHKINAIGEIKEYLIDLIREAIKRR